MPEMCIASSGERCYCSHCDPVPDYVNFRICDGCNVRNGAEHRCHGAEAVVQGEQTGLPCQCPPCRELEALSPEEVRARLAAVGAYLPPPEPKDDPLVNARDNAKHFYRQALQMAAKLKAVQDEMAVYIDERVEIANLLQAAFGESDQPLLDRIRDHIRPDSDDNVLHSVRSEHAEKVSAILAAQSGSEPSCDRGVRVLTDDEKQAEVQAFGSAPGYVATSLPMCVCGHSLDQHANCLHCKLCDCKAFYDSTLATLASIEQKSACIVEALNIVKTFQEQHPGKRISIESGVPVLVDAEPIPTVVNTCTCSVCGFQWKAGWGDDHSCVGVLKQRVSELNTELAASKQQAVDAQKVYHRQWQDKVRPTLTKIVELTENSNEIMSARIYGMALSMVTSFGLSNTGVDCG